MSASLPAPTPIADLTYRNYEGPLRTRVLRWWIVALAGIRIATRRWYFWLFVGFAFLPFLLTGFVLYLQGLQERGGAMLNPMGMPSEEVKTYARHFFQALDWQRYWIFALALSVGAASIAADTRANALLVYLSKPITRVDYLLGKWMSIFLMLFGASVAPALLLYLYCLLSYLGEGFLKNEPYLALQVVGASAVPAAVHASLLIGCSAWSRSGRIAGATYAGLFFLGNVISFVLWVTLYRGNWQKGYLVKNLSVEGVIGGIEQAIFGVKVSMNAFHRREGIQALELAAPDIRIFAPIAIAVVILAVAGAWSKIRAVEVVRG